MPTPRQYQFDVDTKRYLNRVNTYRLLNGLADIQKSDAVDIDNFVIGLKDLSLPPDNLTYFVNNNTIPLNNLVLWFDSGTYSTKNGTVWKDLSIYNHTGELVNNPIYNTSNLGFFQFVTNKLIRIPNSTILDTQTPSVEVWIKTNATNQSGFWFEKGTVNTQYSLFQEGTNIQWRLNGPGTLSTPTASFINTSSWYQVVGTYSSGRRRLYINGILVNSDSPTAAIATNTGGMSIGVFGGFAGARGYYYNGNLAICRVYNKELSIEEIQQIYTATRRRFGLP
jgi:hypothetical protein